MTEFSPKKYRGMLLGTIAIGTYIPTIIEQFGFGEGNQEFLDSAIINILYLIGLIPILLLVEKAGRRPTLIWPFLIMYETQLA
jgi:putative MFS transporter